MLLDVSLKLSPSVPFQQAPCGGCCHNLVLSHCGLWQRGKGPVLFLHPRRPWEPTHLRGITGSVSCLVLCLGSTPLRMENAGLEKLPFTSHLQALNHTHGSWAGKPLFIGSQALKMGPVKDQHQTSLRRWFFSIVI